MVSAAAVGRLVTKSSKHSRRKLPSTWIRTLRYPFLRGWLRGIAGRRVRLTTTALEPCVSIRTRFVTATTTCFFWRALGSTSTGRRFGEALADIERALADAPEDTEALMLRAWTMNGMGRPGEAAADVRLVAELDPYDEMLAEFREEEVDRAVATARRRNAEGNAEAR